MSLTLLIAVCLIAWFWHGSVQAREIGTRVAAETCRSQDLQFLDETVALQRIRPRRDARGHVVLERTYQFEYSEDRSARLRGFVIVLGARVESVGLAASDRSPNSDSASPRPPPG